MSKRQIRVISFKESAVDYIGLEFRYEAGLVGICKSLGATWDGSKRIWRIPNSHENLDRIWAAFKGKIWINQDSYRKANTERLYSQSDKEKASRDLTRRLNDSQRAHLTGFLQHLRAKRYSQSTIRTYFGMIESLSGFIEGIPCEMDQTQLTAYQSDHLYKHQYSISYHRQFIGALKVYLELYPNPSIDADALKRPGKSQQLPTVLSQDEVRRILISTTNLKHRSVLALIYSAGLRISEAQNLRLGDLDFDRLQIHIKNAKGRKWRYVALSKMICVLMNNYIAAYDPIDFVFEGQYGGRYSANSIRKALKKACNKAGIKKKVSPHSLRHSYATHLLESGVDLRFVQELLGHAKPETTMLYTHITRNQLLRIQSPFDELVKGGTLGSEFELPEGER